MKSHKVRSKFIEYFENHGHKAMPSGPLVPENDPSLMFTNAGMNQFKKVFLGIENQPAKRTVTSQKCVRAGGKHNDLENVGHTARHHTFFEMMGNFSFGDYFKKDAIHFAWDFIIKELELDKDRLYVTVFETDDEAADIWHKQEGIPKNKIYRFGEKDNFWRMGDTGPCGPCSEIFYDLGPEVGGDPKLNVMGGEGDRFVEIWNLVFMQYLEEQGGKMTPLPNPSIDTGMGLERTTMVLQGELNSYHTDLFKPLIQNACDTANVEYSLKNLNPKQQQINLALKVLADHARTAAFLMAEGVLPSNEGRGYVLRRIMRRAIRFGRNLNTDTSIYPGVINEVIKQLCDVYPELKDQQNFILKNSEDEEQRFLQTLDQGTNLLNIELNKVKGKTLSGETAFKLYDTFGFPFDLTQLMAGERDIKVDTKGFETAMNEAKATAKKSWKGASLDQDTNHLIESAQDILSNHGETKFLGFENLNSSKCKVLYLSNGKSEVETLVAGEKGIVVLDNTPFYAESGGQAGDFGKIFHNNVQVDVLDCQKQAGIHFHIVEIRNGEINLKDKCEAHIEESRRRDIKNNHSATHLLHAALKNILGDHVTQAGSLVESDRLRFDFSHNKPVTDPEIQSIENLVNHEIAISQLVETTVMTPKKAKEAGAMALFGEKYGDKVRVVKMGDFSMELCGGTHVNNTSQIRLFKIVSESNVSSGVRRIEAVTGRIALEFLMINTTENQSARNLAGIGESWNQYLNESQHSMIKHVESQREEIKNLKKQIQSQQSSQVDLNHIISQAKSFSAAGIEGKFVFADVNLEDRKVLSDITDKLKNKIQSGMVLVVGTGKDSHPIIVSVSKNLTKEIDAGKILKEVAGIMGGRGGGRPDFAQGAAVDRSQLAKAVEAANQILGI